MSSKPRLSQATSQSSVLPSSRPSAGFTSTNSYLPSGDEIALTAGNLSNPLPSGESYDYSDSSKPIDGSKNTSQSQFTRPSPNLSYNYGPPTTNPSFGPPQFQNFAPAGWQNPQVQSTRGSHEASYGNSVSPRTGFTHSSQINQNNPQGTTMYGGMPYLSDPNAVPRTGPTTYSSGSAAGGMDYSAARRAKGISSSDYPMSRAPGAAGPASESSRLTQRDEDLPYIRSSPAYQQAISCRTPRDLSLLLFAIADGVEYANSFNNLRLSGWRAAGDRNPRSGFLDGASFEVFDERAGTVTIQMKGNGGPNISAERWQPSTSKRKHASISEPNYAHYEEGYDYKDARRSGAGEMFDAQLRPSDAGGEMTGWNGGRGGMPTQTHQPGHSPASQRVISILDGITHEEIVARRSQGGDLVPEVAQPPAHLEGNELVEWWASKTADLIKAPSQRRAATKVTNKEYYLIWLYYMALRDAVENNASISQTGPEAETASGRSNHTHAVANAVLRRSHGNYSRNDDRILKKSRKVYQLGHIIGTSPGILVMSDELSGWRLFEWFGTMEEWDNFLARICSDSMSDWLNRVRAKLQV